MNIVNATELDKSRYPGVKKHIFLTPSEYRHMRDLMKAKDELQKFIDWHRNKLLTFSREEIIYEETQIFKEAEAVAKVDSGL